MRKIICLLLTLVLLLGFSCPALADTPTVNLKINGETVYPEAPPFIQGGYTMVPLRFISTSCGMTVDWDAILRRVTVLGETTTLRLDIGSDMAYVNGEQVILSAPPVISNGYTMVPLRFVMENMDALVEWDADTRTVSISMDITAQPVLPVDAQPPAITPAPAPQPMPEQPAPTPTVRAGLVSGYYFDSTSWDMLNSHFADFNTVINFSYKVFADGSVADKKYNSLWTANAEPLLNALGTEKLLLFTDFGDPANSGEEGSAKMLADPAARTRAVANIAALVEQTGADGADIDFELLPDNARDNFTAFIRELKAALGNKLVTISLPPKRSDNDIWLNEFDYVMLGQAADRLHIMFYDQHYSGSEPGPIATPAWIRQGLDYMTKQIPREKIHVMLGVYGRAWGGNVTGTTVTLARATEIITEYQAQMYRDEANGIPYLRYKDKEGNDIVLWYEDAASLGAKAAVAREYQVGGIGVWRMGRVPDDVWQSILANY